MHDFNTPAIDKMVTLEIQDSMIGSGFYKDRDVLQLAKEVSMKANGVFLWAHFAINELRYGWSEGLNLGGLRKKLDNTPEELEDIYARIFRNTKLEQRQYAACLLQLVCYAKRTLNLDELCVATAHAMSEQGISLDQPEVLEVEKFKKRMLAATGGVLEVFRSRRPQATQEFDGMEIETETDKFFVNVIHRTLRTYLESKGWLHVLEAPHEGVLHAQVLWLHVCTRIFPSSFHDLPPIKGNETMQRRIGANPKPPRPPKFPVQLSSTRAPDLQQRPRVTKEFSAPLLEYAALFMLHHAAEVEHVLGLASYDMLQPSLTDNFVCYHRYYWACRDGVCACFRNCPEPLHPLHLAIGHGLDGFVKDFLCIFCEKNTPGSREWDNVFHLEVDMDPVFGIPETFHDSFRMSLLEFAIRHASKHDGNGASQTLIVATLVEKHSHADDAEIISALQFSSAELVRLLLAHRPDGKIVFTSNTLTSDEGFVAELRGSGLSEYDHKTFDTGPMWYITRRAYVHAWKDRAELIDLFIERGEDINDRCGPVGTALHAALLRLYWYNSDPDMLKILIAKGADVNAGGPFGTPLEFLWRLANAESNIAHNIRHCFRAIQLLIENGAVNNRCDPNGTVPGKEQMLAFGRSGFDAYCESLRFYRGDSAHYENSMDYKNAND